MTRISIIGNNASNKNISDGGRLKIRLYSNLLKKCGYEVNIIDLNNWKIKFISLLVKIKRAIKYGDIILIMGGPKGCRITIPMVNKFNKKKNSRVVFCPLGIGTIDSVVSNLNKNELNNFINCVNFYGKTDIKMGAELKKIDLVIPQNETLVNLYKKFYGLKNVELLYNFRDCEIKHKTYKKDKKMSIIYASRVCENKGIFDLLNAVKDLRQNGLEISLDIYGELQLNKNELDLFNTYINKDIIYNGIAAFDEMINIIGKYDLFCLPTKYYGEGTSGSLIESFIAGTPSLVSSYSQALSLINDNVTGFIYKIGDVESLKCKLIEIYSNRELIQNVGQNLEQVAQKYVFSYNKEKFLKYLTDK